MTDMPSVGRIVHYVSYGTPGGEYASVCRAAVVTAVPSGVFELGAMPVDLAVLNPEGMFFNRGVPHSELEHHGGTWHWPERV
jgi:hypothetical protein